MLFITYGNPSPQLQQLPMLHKRVVKQLCWPKHVTVQLWSLTGHSRQCQMSSCQGVSCPAAPDTRATSSRSAAMPPPPCSPAHCQACADTLRMPPRSTVPPFIPYAPAHAANSLRQTWQAHHSSLVCPVPSARPCVPSAKSYVFMVMCQHHLELEHAVCEGLHPVGEDSEGC